MAGWLLLKRSSDFVCSSVCTVRKTKKKNSSNPFFLVSSLLFLLLCSFEGIGSVDSFYFWFVTKIENFKKKINGAFPRAQIRISSSS